ncbi:MAG: porin [Deltaproteobacteria bacterium]|jgi:hypothetical protein|nr:porin [Deltaproteobacteria bacterium]
MKMRTLVLAFATALVFTAAGSPEASAESPVTFSGYLRLRTIAMGGFFPSGGTGDEASDRYAQTRLRLNVSFKPTDNLEIRWRFHGPHNSRWGTTNTGNTGDFSLYSLYFFGIVKTDWGTISVGRVSSDIDSAGLKTMGYTPSWGFSTQGWIFDRDSENDGIMYTNKWDNGWGLKAFYVKRASRTPVAVANEINRDIDYDRFSIEPYYKWETGSASLALQYDRNNYDFDSNGVNVVASPATTNVKTNYFFSINPALIQTFAVGQDKNLTLHAEAKYSVGRRQAGPVAGVDQKSERQDGFGAYADLQLNYPQGDAALAGWYFSGDDGGPGYRRPADRKYHGLVTPGEGFYPFLIMYYGHTFVSGSRSLEGYQSPGHWAVALLGNHKFNDYVQLNYGVGTFRRTNDWYLESGEKASRTLGSEINLGLTIKIMDNLMWQTKLALFDAGSFYSERWERPEFDRTLWGWNNEFLFSF